jgi:serine/threonine protein kinase
LTNALPEDGLDRAMKRVSLTPIQKHNPKISDTLAKIIEKCLEIQPQDRYQSADELRYDLMEARSISRRKLPFELVLQPPPITLHDRLPEGKGGDQPVQASGGLREAGGKKVSTQPLELEAGESLSANNGSKKGLRSRWLLLMIFPALLLGGLATYLINPGMVTQAIGQFFPRNSPTYTSVDTTPTGTSIPLLVIESKTPTPTNTPTSTITIVPSATFTPAPSPSPTITNTPLPTPIGGSDQIAFTTNRSGAVEIWLMNNDGSDIQQVTNIPEGACQPRWSPDGLRLVFISPCTRQQSYYPGASLFLINADGSGLTPLPNVPGGDYDPSWSPDGKHIAFTSLRNNGVPGIYVINLETNSVTSLVEDETRAIYQPAWSPNGQEIAYVNSDNRIGVMDVNGENRHGLTVGGVDYKVSSPSWSPDGSVVIFSASVLSDTTGATTLMAVPYTPTGAMPVSVPNSLLITDASYSIDGYWLLFSSWYSGNHEISVMRPNGIDRHAILIDQAYDFDPAWRPNPVK